MKRKSLTAFLTLLLIMSILVTEASANVPLGQVQPDTWVAVDDLGRTVENNTEIKKDNTKNRFVGMFFWDWHDMFADNGVVPHNVTQILEANPGIELDYNNSAWEGATENFFWNEPVYGYYRSSDEYVIRKQAELLADAGVDVIIFDCTNGGMLFEKSYKAIFNTFEKAREEGVKTPQIAFMLNFFSPEANTKSLRELYAGIYKKEHWKDLWFMWEGKPLVLGDASKLNLNDKREKTISEFFTIKRVDPAYIMSYEDDGKTWGWLSVYPQTEWGKTADGRPEQMTVGVAQNANFAGNLSSMNAGDVRGRTFTDALKGFSTEENAILLGPNFQEQWDRAIEKDPDFVFITGWNEWVAGRHKEWQGNQNAFPDEFTDEFSRDIEPSNGKLKDYYYLQLCENIRKYKGVTQTDIESYKTTEKTIDIFGSAVQWDDVKTYYHYESSTYERNSTGYTGTSYKSDAIRNDVIKTKVAYDSDNVYFYVETKDNITPHTDPAWMRLFIDTDESNEDNQWAGFEYVINREGSTDSTVSIEKATQKNQWTWERVADAYYTVQGNVMQISVSKDDLDLGSTPAFNFKWSDNMQNDGDFMDFYKYGEAAPGSRFMYAFNREEMGSRGGLHLSTEMIIVIIISAVAVIMIAIVVVLLITMKKKKRA